MAVTDVYRRIPCGEIVIDRENRQRRELKLTAEFKESIASRGVLQPIIVTRELQLIAGERRLTASLELGLPDIPCRFFEDLDPAEAQIVELEENLKRSDLSWQDMVRAVKALWHYHKAKDPNYSQMRLAKLLALDSSYIGRILRVGEDIESPRIASMTSMDTAFNALKRHDERRAGDAVNSILSAGPGAFGDVPESVPATPLPADGVAPPTAPSVSAQPAFVVPGAPPTTPIDNIEFETWARSYRGEKFNFLHCDFPYGVNIFDGQYGDAAGDKHYEDTAEIYFHLIDVLAENLDNILGYSAHVMFWFSLEHYEATLAAFREKLPSITWNKFPLIWAKSDNVGIMPDPKRGPRRVYETCLMGTRGDRPVVKPIANFYSCPTDKQYHPSTKPVPMLKHFFQMFVDSGTRLLDPTCGSGSALRAAADMGAPYLLGLEQDKEHYTNAVRAYTTFSNMRKVTNG